MSNNVVQRVRQSPPVDTSAPYDPAWVRGKTILITGGASGFGEAFFRKWAENGANVIIGDINDRKGEALASEIRAATGGKHYFIHCDVADWQSQVDFFRAAVKLSPTGGIDSVVANAGIVDNKPTFEIPVDLDADAPPKPNFKVMDINLTGLMYTTHLAIFYLPRNPKSQSASPLSDPTALQPDRHILLLGSVASLMPLPGQLLYCTAKHGVLGLFRGLRSTAFTNGIRVNMLCPYFIETPLFETPARLILAGGGVGKIQDVVDAGTRLMADTRIVGRALIVGPKIKTSPDDEYKLVPQTSADGKELNVWEAYADDFEEVEVFCRRFIGLVNQIEQAKGWVGWASDLVGAVTFPFRNLIGK